MCLSPTVKYTSKKLGTAIGTKFAPAYANWFISCFEEDILNSCEVKPWMMLLHKSPSKMFELFSAWHILG